MPAPEKNVILEKSARIEIRLREIEKLLEDPEILRQPEKNIALNREYRSLRPVLEKAEDYRKLLSKIEGDSEIVRSTADAELKEIARQELEENKSALDRTEQEMKRLLIPRNPEDEKSAIVEIRAGTGGEEAALFAGDLYRMYSKYIENRGWRKELIASNPTGLGGFKEIIFSVSGENAFGTLKFESGVHRVQRVPVTETGGRIHTSASSVVVLPEAEEVDIDIDPKDIRIDVYRSSGPGGQSVNTTDSAVRITHIPTGMIVTCQDEKSQHKNKAKALKVLRARLFDLKKKEEEARVTASRRSMIGTGDRSEKIRTYNFPQGRVTDHRINLTMYRLPEILDGDIGELADRLKIADVDARLKDEK
jgi:peptide chain release factor 1